jgi:hypothetical protein
MKKLLFFTVMALLVSAGYGQKLSATTSKSATQSEYIGLWKYPPELAGGSENILLGIRKDAKLGYVMEMTDAFNLQDRSTPTLLTRKTVNGKTVYVDTDEPEQYYVVEKNGNLSAYDNYGFIETYKKHK